MRSVLLGGLRLAVRRHAMDRGAGVHRAGRGRAAGPGAGAPARPPPGAAALAGGGAATAGPGRAAAGPADVLLLRHAGVPWRRSPAIAAVSVAFIIYAAAFLGQIWHGGIQAVKHEQWEAAACLGLSKWHQFRHVIAPQALRLSLPPTVGFLVQLIGAPRWPRWWASSNSRAPARSPAPPPSSRCWSIHASRCCTSRRACLTMWARNLEDRLHGAR